MRNETEAQVKALGRAGREKTAVKGLTERSRWKCGVPSASQACFTTVGGSWDPQRRSQFGLEHASAFA